MSYEDLRPHLQHILEKSRLTTLLQPILDLMDGRIMGYEALSRGPSNSPLHAPQALFAVAEHHGLLPVLDWACLHTAIKTFARLKRHHELPRAGIAIYRRNAGRSRPFSSLPRSGA